jgi:spore coat protein U-like protein
MNNKFAKAMLLTAIVGFTGTASAATTTTSMTVSANVLGTCVVSTTGIAFGTYDPVQATALTSSTTISTTCTSGLNYNIALDAGLGSGASTSNPRIMTSNTNPADTLAYGLFRDSGYTQNWGNTVGTDTVALAGTGAAQTTTVYGQIAPGLVTNTGQYLDTVTVTVSY